MPDKIGFVGVGRMGANMARRLKECGFPVTAIFDANAAAQSLAQELGCIAAGELKVVTALADVILTVVTDDRAMKQIYRGGLLTRSKGKLFINCATITPAVHVWVEQKCEARGAQSLEACMASSIPQARQGMLCLMCAGKPETFERARPVLEKLSASLRYIGAAGRAATKKQYDRMVKAGLGGLDKSGIAELTFKGRRPVD
jgi:3-hydroxyisobutyrate dehydrogenase